MSQTALCPARTRTTKRSNWTNRLAVGKRTSIDESADLSFIPQKRTEMSCLVSWSRRRINKVSMGFVDVLCQYGCREAGCFILEDDLSGVIGLILMEPSPRIEEKKVWYVFVL